MRDTPPLIECLDDKLAIDNEYSIAKKKCLSPKSTKIYIWCISQIKKTDSQLITFRITAEDFKNAFNSRNVKRDLESIAKELTKFQVHLKTDSGSFGYVNIIDSFIYDNETKLAHLTFTQTAWRCFVNLGGNGFSIGALKIFMNSSSHYAFNLYLYLHGNHHRKTFTIDIEELSEILGLAPSYSLWGNLNSQILKPLRIEFAATSPIKFSYKPANKIGLKYTAIQFKVNKGKYQPEFEENNPMIKIEQGSVEDGSDHARDLTKNW